MAELVDWLHHESITRAGTNSGTSYIPTLKTAKCPLCGKETDILIYKDGVLVGCRYCGVRPPIQTNADKLRSMSDEELAEFLYNVWKEQDTFSKEVCERCGDTDIGCRPNCWLDWLRKEEESEVEG